MRDAMLHNAEAFIAHVERLSATAGLERGARETLREYLLTVYFNKNLFFIVDRKDETELQRDTAPYPFLQAADMLIFQDEVHRDRLPSTNHRARSRASLPNSSKVPLIEQEANALDRR